jgi:hypothetical protein
MIILSEAYRLNRLDLRAHNSSDFPHLKDRLQKVPNGDSWLRRHFSFPGNFCLHLRAISGNKKKAIKTQFPTCPFT